MCNLPQGPEPVNRLRRLLHGLTELPQIRSPVLVDLPIGVGYDLKLILGIYHLEMVYVRAVVDVSVDCGFLIFCKSGVFRQPSDDEGPQTVNSNLDALGHVRVLNWTNHQHLEN